MIRRSWRSSALLAPLLLAGCLPYPHMVSRVPAVRGLVTSGGNAFAGVRVHVVEDVHRNNPCLGGEFTATTDAGGSFAMRGRRGVALLLPMVPAHAMDSWAVALLQGDQPVGYIRPWFYRVGGRGAPDDVELKCDLEERSCLMEDDNEWTDARQQLLPCEAFSSHEFSG